MEDRIIIAFSERFSEIIKALKSFQETFFLDSHKSIKITISKDSISCYANLGRYIIQFKEVPNKIDGAPAKPFSISLEVEQLKKFIDIGKESLKLIIDNGKLFIFSSNNKFPIEQAKAPEEIDLPFVSKQEYTEENTKFFNELFNKCYQKENLISFKDNFMYEKLTDNLYHLESLEFPDSTFAYKDFKVISVLTGDKKLSYNRAPMWYLFATEEMDIYIMKYKKDTVDKEPFKRRQKIRKQDILNAVTINTQEFKKLADTLSITGADTFGIVLNTNSAYIGGVNVGVYKLDTVQSIHVIRQEFLMNKKEINLITKYCPKDEMKIVACKDFIVISNKFLLMAKVSNSEEKN